MDFPHFWLGLVFLSGVAISEQCIRHGISCPNYTVVATHDGYEERLYPSLVWVSTSAAAKHRSQVSKSLIYRLHRYLMGENVRGQRLDKMVPVRTTKLPGEDQNTYVMAVALAQDFQENPPEPTNSSVTLVREPTKTYFVRSFGSLVLAESQWDQEAQTLRNALVEGNTANATFYFRCVYDDPFHVVPDRLNEVWLSPQ